MTSKHQIIRVMIGAMIAALVGCVATDDSDTADKRDRNQGRQADATSEDVSPPANITGTYLFCDHQDNATEGSVNLDCRVTDENAGEKLVLSNYFTQPTFYFQPLADATIAIESIVGGQSDPYHVRLVFKAAEGQVSSETLELFRLMFRASPRTQEQSGMVLAARTPFSSALADQLPEQFVVYVSDGVVINQPQIGFEPRILPTVNHTYQPLDGCYIACYSNSPEQAAYAITEDIFVMGQLRVQGSYEGRICRPLGIDPDVDLAGVETIKAACNENIPACAGDLCWGGGDTGGWYGLQ